MTFGVPKFFYIILIVCLTACAALAQTAAISAAPSSGVAGGQATFNISLSGGAQPAALQWTIGYSTADIASVSVTVAGTAASTAKTVSCTDKAGSTTCLIYGMNTAVIPDGAIAQVSVRLSPTVTAL